MKKKHSISTTKNYLAKYAFQPVREIPIFAEEVKNIIVVPCYLEPDLIATLDSLWKCDEPSYPTLVVAVINNSAKASEEAKAFNKQTYEAALQWVERHPSKKLFFHCLLETELPPKHAGVGLARKIGMDAALNYFSQIEHNGFITCLDADCTVQPNYLTELEKTALNTHVGAATISYRHLYETLKDKQAKEGIIHYELFLRYYILALRFANYPFAMHTIGSSMACRAEAYANHGGMNRRKAGEDFYFLHKLAPHENFIHLNKTFVFPSSRTSFRVPFGTGKAQKEWLAGQSKIAQTYGPVIFKELKIFINAIEKHLTEGIKIDVPKSISEFLSQQNFEQELLRIKQGTNSKTQAKTQFYQWFDGFKVLKMVHFLRDNHYDNIPLKKAAQTLLGWLNPEIEIPSETADLLEVFRETDDSN